MTDIEIPLVEERDRKYRFFEMFPALVSWFIIFIPIALSFINATWAAYFVIGFLIVWFLKAAAMGFRVIQGYNKMERLKDMRWDRMLKDIDDHEAALDRLQSHPAKGNEWHYRNLLAYAASSQTRYKTTDVIHAVIVATYNEALEIIEPTIKAVHDSHIDSKQVILIIAYEERGGPKIEETSKQLIEKYGKKFLHAEAIKHPDKLPNEVIGKGGNITYAGYELEKYLKKNYIEPERVIVTTLDADNRPHANYFAGLTYAYLVTEDRQHKSFQPIPMYTNNIWDAPAPSRIIATGSSFWWIIQSVRPHLLRNFSSHAQGMHSLIDTDFWSTRTIVEDGHQFWRTYFRYDGRHDVVPLFIPIYQDAVLSERFRTTLKAQFIQLRRWAYGASDIAYVATKGFRKGSKVPRIDLTFKFARLLETHVSWATASLILAFAAWLPVLINPNSDDSIIAHQLPVVVSRVQMVLTLGILVSLYLTLRILPPKPARYRRHRHVFMVIQWALLPVVSLLYGSLSAMYSQARLFLGKYIGKFDVTEKAVKKH